MPAILVAGGAGYIGSHTVKALVRAGRRVVVYDNLSSGHQQAVTGAAFVEGDISDVAALRRTMRQHEVDAVMQFAAFLIVSDSVGDPIGYYRNNVRGTLSVLEAMALESVGRLVFSSTCAVYGEPIEVPITESHPTNPINPYGETKLAIERALPHFERAYGLKAIRLRYFNAAGADPEGELGEEHDPEIHLIPRAIDAARGGAELLVFGDDYGTPDGTCLRDYIHVTDLADAHVRALDRLEGGGSSTVYNLGYGRPYSVEQVVDAVSDVVGRPVPCRLAPRRPGDPAVLYAANGRARQELGWEPRYDDLRTIVEHAWRWRETHPNGYPPDR
ncbi:MAG: UDP-glucose 4-epimerase GalE [Acidobacteria bacterium]|nr:UDP-glucose 4-epimerase GalE [Acidobacteriota bacterium]